MEEEHIEITLSMIREAMVYKIPPLQTSSGYRCSDWKPSDHMWTGRVRIVSKGNDARIRLEAKETGELFAECRIKEDGSTVDRCVDSSRYFVLCIEDGTGRKAFIGMGFQERNDAFDFTSTIADHIKSMKQASAPAPVATGPPRDFSLKQGQTISINLKGKTAKPASKTTAGAASSSGASLIAPGGGLLPPPSGGARPLAPPGGIAPPPAAPAAQPAQAGMDDWGDFAAAPSAGSGNAAPGGNDWVNFG